MRKKQFSILAIVLGILFLLFLLGNIGLNFWLQKKLPDYVKNNSAYLVSYNELDVHLGSGNIFATGLNIKNKNPENHQVVGLEGSIDTLLVSRVALFDLLLRNRINMSDVSLRNPNLRIVLAKPTNTAAKKENRITFKNIHISRGNLQVFMHTRRKLLGISDLSLDVKNLQTTKKPQGNKLPFKFDSYELNGKTLYYRAGNYAITAKSLSTRNNQLEVKNLAVVPLLSIADFKKFYPAKKNLFSFKTAEMNFKDIVLNENKVALKSARLENPDLQIWTTNATSPAKKNPFPYDVNLEDVLLNNARIQVLKPDGKPLFEGGNLAVSINKFVMNEETSGERIPFQYADFKISGRNVRYSSGAENIWISSLDISPKAVDLRSVQVKSSANAAAKTRLDLSVPHIAVKINESKFIKNKIKLDLQHLVVDGLKGKITVAKNAPKKKANFQGIAFPLVIKNIAIKNANLTYEKDSQPLVFNSLSANLQNLEMNAATARNAIPFKTGKYSISTKNFSYKTKFYNLYSSLLKLTENTAQVSDFAMQPRYSRAQFIRMIPAEKDLYDLKAARITMNGNWDLVADKKFLHASQITINGADANIFRSKIPKDDLTEKPLYSKLLRSIKFPIFVNNFAVKNSLLVYEEDTRKSDGPGKLTFDRFNLTARNINSAKMKGQPTQIPIDIDCRFMGVSPMHVKWTINTANPRDEFTIGGNISDLPADHINPFIEPYLKIRATGTITGLNFDFKGNSAGIGGTMKMKHEDLKIAFLRQDGEKNLVLSAVANLFIKSNSGNDPEAVSVENVERDQTKSFFNLFWRGIEQGLKKTLIGPNAPKTEESVRTVVDNTKAALQENKKDLQETKADLNRKIEDAKEKVQQTKDSVKEEGFFKKIFKKKTGK